MEKNILFVDLDDSLIKTDTLFEMLLELGRTQPLSLWRVPIWFFDSRARLKTELAKRTKIAPELLPVRQDVLDYIRKQRELGREIHLISGSPHEVVARVSDHFGLFSGYQGTQDSNFTGRAKLKYIDRVAGQAPWAYVGDSFSDLPIWEKAHTAVVVEPGYFLKQRLKNRERETEIIKSKSKGALSFAIRGLRVHQWLKNLLLFAPLVAAHKIFDTSAWIGAVGGFFVFSAAASSVYLFNDLYDLNSDRRHPRKKLRAIAAGDLSIPAAAALSIVLAAGALFGASRISPDFFGVIALYLGANVLYSFYLKRIVAFDVVFLTILYTLRILAGGFASAVPVSNWLLAFSTFFFLGLAMVKRTTELIRLGDTHGRDYKGDDLRIALSAGPASSLMSVVVLVLYFNSHEVTVLYHNTGYLWLLTPAFLYWNLNLWMRTNRGEVNDDPLVFAAKSPSTWWTAAFVLTVLYLSA